MVNEFNTELNVEIKGLDSVERATQAFDELDKAILKAADSAEDAESRMSSSTSKKADQEQQLGEEIGKTTQQRRRQTSEEEKNKKAWDKAWDSKYSSLANTRYALYDVAAMYGSVSIAATAVAAATAGVGASYEKSFASVARTTMETGQGLQAIRDDLIDLSKVMPIAFQDITDIATLGAQLGIASADLADFTQTVAMFSATTNVSVEETATSIGRLTQLTKTAGSEISNLASAIYATGVTAVATEGEILSVAEQIATTGDLAGLTNYQIVALASSLASLGVAPESARGSMMRIFNTIETGATNGGEALEKIARISGMSMAEIQSTWGKDSQAVFTAFVEGLGNMQDAGLNTNNMLKELGIGAVRDIRALQLLANNTEVYAQALGETEKAYRENTALQDGYAIGTDTLVDQLSRLKNNLKALVGQGTGFNTVLKKAVSVINEVLDAISGLLNNPVGKFFVGMTAAIAIAVAAWASFHVALNLARGGLAAFITAQMGLANAGAPLTKSLRGIAREFWAISVGGKAAIDRIVATETAVKKLDGGMSLAKRGASALGSGLLMLGRTVAPIAAVSAALWGISKATEAWQKSRMSKAELAENYFGDISGLADAIKQDTEKGDNSIRNMTVSVEESTSTLSTWAQSLQDSSGAQIGLSEATAETTTKTKEATVALGELTRAQMAQMILEKITPLWEKYGEVLTDAGFKVSEFTDAALKGTGQEYVSGILDKVSAEASRLRDVMDGSTTDIAAQNAASEQWANIMNNGTIPGLRAMSEMAEMSEGSIESAAAQAHLAGQVFEGAGVQINEAGEDIGDTATNVDTLADSVSNFISEMEKMNGVGDALYSLGESFAENGLIFDNVTSQGRANMQELQNVISAMAASAGEDSALFAGNVMNLMADLQSQGVVVSSELDWVYQLLNQIAGSQYGINFNTQAAREDIHKFINDLIVAQRQAVLMSGQAYNTLSGAAIGADPAAAARLKADYDQQAAKLTQLEALQQGLRNASIQTERPVKQIANGWNNAARNTDKASKAASNAKKNTKEVAKEIRTSADYAKDLAGVFDEIFDISFGLRNSQADVRDSFKDIMDELIGDSGSRQLELFSFDRKEMKDGITQTFIDLKQAAADAQKEVRDSVLAVKDAQAKLQGLNAEGSTLDYQLLVAKALGSSERIAEIEAKIAQNKAEQAQAAADVADAEERRQKAIESTSTSTSGDSSQAIANRAKLRDLAKQYMEYADVLREAGVSEAEIQKYLNQSEKDFEAQAAALGFSKDQIAPYIQGITSMTGNIDKNSTALKGNEDKLDDLFKAHLDAVAAFAATGASQKDVAKFAEESRKKFFEQAKQLGFNTADLKSYDLAWQGVKKTIATIPSAVTIRANVNNPSAAPLQKFMQEWNNKQLRLNASVNDSSAKDWRNKNTGGKGASDPIDVQIKTHNDDAGSKRAARKKQLLVEYWDLASQAQRAFDRGDILRGQALLKQSNAKKAAHDKAPAYRKGGHTGNGYKEDIAGNVHFGEYVFPYEAVDQRSGLPKPEALISMLGATIGSMPFMSGGQQYPMVNGAGSLPQIVVASSNDLSVVELLPSQIIQIGQVIANALPSSPMLSDIVMAVNSVNATRTGKGQG